MLVVQAVAMLLLARGLASDGSPAGSKNLARQMLGFGLRAYPGSVSALLWQRAAVFMLNAFHGPASVGIFSVAQQLTEKLWLPTLAMQDVTYHGLSQGPRSTATQLMNRYLRFAFWGLIPVTLVGGMLVSWALPVLLGQAYDSAARRFPNHAGGQRIDGALAVIDTVLSRPVTAPGPTAVLAWVNVVLNLALALWAIPPWAETGAALAVVGAQGPRDAARLRALSAVS